MCSLHTLTEISEIKMWAACWSTCMLRLQKIHAGCILSHITLILLIYIQILILLLILGHCCHLYFICSVSGLVSRWRFSFFLILGIRSFRFFRSMYLFIIFHVVMFILIFRCISFLPRVKLEPVSLALCAGVQACRGCDTGSSPSPHKNCFFKYLYNDLL